MSATDVDPGVPGRAGSPRPLIYISGVDPTGIPGGHPSYVRAHALAARAAGFSPHIFCVSASSGVELTDFGVLHRVATPVRHLLLAPVYTRPVAHAVADYLGRCSDGSPHIIHAFGRWAGAAASASAHLRVSGTPAVPVASAYTTLVHEWRGVLRGLDARHGMRAAAWYRGWSPWVRTVGSWAERRGLERVRVVLVNYDSVARLLRDELGPQLNIRRLPYAAPGAFGPDAGSAPAPDPLERLRPAAAPLVLSVSRHDARKGLNLLLRALAMLKANGVRYRACLVGPGRLLHEHRRLAADLALGDRVAIPGQVPDVTPYLRHADVFVLPSLEEGSGSVSLLEALQAGLPIVASSCDGIPEDVVDREHGLLVAPGDERGLTRALAELLADPVLRARLGANARRLYLDRFSAQRFVSALRDTYAELGVTA